MTEQHGSIVSRVLDWLRAGYPDGVPPQDQIPLLGILHRTLTDTEVESVARGLATDLGGEIGEDAIAEAIRVHIHETAAPADVARVSARLALAGWPLAAPADVPVPPAEQPGRLKRIVDWLREGYPTGVPATDFNPLLALLRRRLTDEEVKQVARSLRDAGIAPASPADIGAEIARITNDLPSREDIRRVHDRLAAKGWPLDFPDPGSEP